MRVKIYSLKPKDGVFRPTGGEWVLDKDLLHCIITIKDGKGDFKFLNASREKLIRDLFNAPSTVFVAGGTSLDGAHWDAIQSHPAWSVEAIEAIVKHELYGCTLGATIEYDDRRSILARAANAIGKFLRPLIRRSL